VKRLTSIVLIVWLFSLIFFLRWHDTLSPEEKEQEREANEPFNMTITEMREKSPRLFNFMIVVSAIMGICFYLMTRGYPV